MPIVGFNLTKIAAERKLTRAGKVQISNNVTVTSVKEENMDPKQQTLRIGFTYTSTTDPDIGSVNIEGAIAYMPAGDELKDWKEGKPLPQKLAQGILNQALAKCSIQALVLSKEVGLPSPIPLPQYVASPAKAPAPAAPAKKGKQ